METKLDSVGRIVVPKQLRDALGLIAGSRLDISLYGEGLTLIPENRTARLDSDGGVLVADSTTIVTDEMVFGLIDSARK